MKRIILTFIGLLFALPAFAQNPGITRQGAVTANHCAAWASNTQIKDGGVCGGVPGGSANSIQYNNGGAFGGFGSYNSTLDAVQLTGPLLLPFNSTAANFPPLAITGTPGTGANNVPLQSFAFGSATATYSTNGTLIGAATPSAFTGNFNDYWNNGNRNYSVSPIGIVLSPNPLTGSAITSALAIAQTWNTSGTPTAVNVNVTDTASNAASLLFSYQVGGALRASLSKTGIFILGRSSDGATRITLDPNADSIGAVNILANGTNGSFQINADTFLRRDAANIWALRNAANPNTLRVYGTFTDTSNGDWLSLTKAAGGTATIATVANGTGTAGALAISVNGTISTFATSGNFTSGASVIANAGSFIGFSGRTFFSSAADGVVLVANNATNNFDRMQFGGTTASFPALKRSSAVLQARLADDSLYAAFEANTLRTATPYTVSTLPTGATGMHAYVTDQLTACVATGIALTGGGSVVCPTFYNGTAWVGG